MKVVIVPNLKKICAKECTDELLSILKQFGCQTFLKTDLFSESGAYLEIFQPELAQCDLFIAVGGDGTIIHAAKLSSRFGKPILGINAGKLGFTAGVERGNLELLPNLFQGAFTLEKRCMLTASILRDGKTPAVKVNALNDVVVSGELSKIIDYKMSLDGEKWYPYRADGFIAATPTGSTAYSLSAGGPVIEPTMRCIVYTPICPHSLFNRSVIFSPDTHLQVELPENSERLQLTADGEPPIPLMPGDCITFSIADCTADFIKLDKTSFYDILNQKIVESR